MITTACCRAPPLVSWTAAPAGSLSSTPLRFALEQAGMKINTVSPEEVARMREKVQPVVDKYTQELGPDLIRQLNAEIGKARN